MIFEYLHKPRVCDVVIAAIASTQSDSGIKFRRFNAFACTGAEIASKMPIFFKPPSKLTRLNNLLQPSYHARVAGNLAREMHPVHLFDKIDKVRSQGHIIWSDKS
jgi:hypothetical protein